MGTSDDDIADPDEAAKSRRSSRKKSSIVGGESLDIQQVDGADDLIHRSDLIHQVDGGDEGVTSTSDDDITDPDEVAKSRRSSRKKSKVLHFAESGVDGADDLIHRSDLIHQVDGGDEVTTSSDDDITDPDEAAKSRRSSR